MVLIFFQILNFIQMSKVQTAIKIAYDSEVILTIKNHEIHEKNISYLTRHCLGIHGIEM